MKKIKVCTSSKCSKNGAEELIDKIEEVLKTKGMDKKVEIKKCSCMGECGKGIAVQFGKDDPKNRGTDEILKKLSEKLEKEEE